MAIKYSKASLDKLQGVHPDLVRVFMRVAEICPADLDFRITCGLRTLAEQKKLLAEGKSRTLKSRHLTGHAVDVAILEGKGVTWDIKKYAALAEVVRQAARDVRVPIIWGGDWDNDGSYKDESFVDGPHFELSKHAYPAK